MSTHQVFGPVVNGTQIVFYEYRPNKAAGISFIALFGTITLVHLVYSICRLRAWHFIPLFLGGLGETFGYLGRALSSDNPDDSGPFILQTMLLLVAAPFLAATVYMTTGRMIVSLGPKGNSFLGHRWMTKLYVLVDIACILSQLYGTGLVASGNPSKLAESRTVIIACLITQFVAMFVFILSCGFDHMRFKTQLGESMLYTKYFISVEAAGICLLVRNLVRAFEYLQGSNGFVITHEAFIYLFDALPMFLMMSILAFLNPARLIRERKFHKANQIDSEEQIMLGRW